LGRAIAVSWWALAIRGVLGILLGIAAFAWTGITLTVLITLFAVYLIVDGLFALIAGGRARSWLLLLEGALGLAAGIVAALLPMLTVLVLIYVIAAWAILSGITELGAAYMLRRIITNEWLLILGGIASIAFGLVLAANPAVGAVTLVWLFGAYMLVFGALTLALAMRLRASRARLVIGAA
jgi:uncharacterized membrane protein HdeD (DUF308 family)